MEELEYPFDGAYILQKKRSIKRALSEKTGLIPKKIAIMSGSTIGEIKNILELFLLNEGIRPEFYVGGYALYYENLMFDDGSLAAFAPDMIYIHTSSQNITDWPVQSDAPQAVEEKLNAAFARFEQLWQAAARFGCPVIQNNFEQPPYRLMGNMDAVDVHGRVNFVNRLNAKFSAYAAKTPNFYLNDIQYLSASVGIDNWFSPATWYAYKYALDTPYIATLCHSVACIVKSLFGKNKKSVVLDLDNTLWGGIIGDDGPEGIVLGKESPAGMAYSEFQRYLKELTGLGVVLNVCSKNEEANALAGFARSDSTLKRDDFLCFKANWEPKHINVAAIANEINIGTDALVFLDDNPAEREIVKNELPGVSVPELTAPETYLRSLDRAGYFEVTLLSADDKKRGEMYKQNLQRAAAQQSFGDYSDYLRSLAMRAEIGSFDAQHAERITQLINKTNQFNMTTRRYTAAEVEALLGSPDCITLYGRLLDKFGDNGIVTALIAHVHGTEADIVLWIMSCRTFKRNLEHAMFDRLVAECAARGITRINGFYAPTAKNLLVSDFYATIGFEKTDEDANGNKTFAFTAFDGYTPQNTVMETVLL
ncbi:MAG: HAD-IIIC family phosphatase [Ruthenibacterium sp.]